MTKLGDAQSIIELAFAAAIDETLWPAVVAQVAAQIGSIGTFLGVADTQSVEPRYFQLSRVSDRVVDEYAREMRFHDPQVAFVQRLQTGSLYCDADHVDLHNAVTAEYMRWQHDRTGWYGHTTIAAALSDHLRSGLSFHFAKGENRKAVDAKAILAPIAPSIAQALRLGFRHTNELTHEYWRAIASRLDDRAALLLNERGQVIRANASAERLFDRGQIVQLRRGCISCPSHSETEQLRAMIDGAVRAQFPEPGAMLVGRTSNGRRLVRVSPVVRSHRSMVLDEPAALLTIQVLAGSQISFCSLWQQIFGLTDQESRVADFLRLGRSAAAVADALGISPATVRTHIKIIHQKTDTQRNAELAHLLTSIASQA